jgi:ubiquinone/menaquinone biosynthesis C-methylase UbiE
MDTLQKDDVPYGDDWDSAAVVTGWAKMADQKRPWRGQIRDHIAAIVATLPNPRVLELGSGPGFLARRVLDRCPNIESYTLLDFSEHMLGLSRERLVAFPAATFVLGTFKSDDWTCHVGGPFDCVLAMQSVHELRHKRHATRLYEQVYQVLSVPGLFAICDHLPFDDSPKSTTLYMTEREQHQALAMAGFSNVHTELSLNGLVLYVGDRTA